MIQIDHVETCGWEAAVRGMRNPMNSWEKSDSRWRTDDRGHLLDFRIGPNDLVLMKRLAAAGTDHSKFLRMICISLDVTAPMYWWKEFDTYRVGICPNPTDVEYNSTSTMHKIAAKEFTREDFSCDHLFGASDEHYAYYDDAFTNGALKLDSSGVLDLTIKSLNFYRALYLQTNEKRYWWQLIQLLPSSYNYLRTVSLNYAAARNIYRARRNHKLDEWHDFCAALEQLPCARELIVT